MSKMDFNIIHTISDRAKKAEHTRFEHAIDDQLAAIEAVKDDLDKRQEHLKKLSKMLDTADKATILAVLYPEHHVKNKPQRSMEVG
jgi:cell division protein ZapA (FtsZ GTPase activity inhibitor)